MFLEWRWSSDQNVNIPYKLPVKELNKIIIMKLISDSSFNLKEPRVIILYWAYFKGRSNQQNIWSIFIFFYSKIVIVFIRFEVFVYLLNSSAFFLQSYCLALINFMTLALKTFHPKLKVFHFPQNMFTYTFTHTQANFTIQWSIKHASLWGGSSSSSRIFF